MARAAANYICAKRLVPFLPELVPTLEWHGYLQLPDAVRAQVLAVSPATADRLLQPRRQKDSPRGLGTTRVGRLLKHQIPIRTFADWNETRPGFLEADLVAHCGWTVEGSFLHTLVLTDVASGWTECLVLSHRSQTAFVRALDRAQQLLPMPLLGLDTTTAASSHRHLRCAQARCKCQRRVAGLLRAVAPASMKPGLLSITSRRGSARIAN